MYHVRAHDHPLHPHLHLCRGHLVDRLSLHLQQKLRKQNGKADVLLMTYLFQARRARLMMSDASRRIGYTGVSM